MQPVRTSPSHYPITRLVKKVAVASKVELQKRYLKYLTKKYLKKNDILDYLRLIATDKNTYGRDMHRLAEKYAQQYCGQQQITAR